MSLPAEVSRFEIELRNLGKSVIYKFPLKNFPDELPRGVMDKVVRGDALLIGSAVLHAATLTYPKVFGKPIPYTDIDIAVKVTEDDVAEKLRAFAKIVRDRTSYSRTPSTLVLHRPHTDIELVASGYEDYKGVMDNSALDLHMVCSDGKSVWMHQWCYQALTSRRIRRYYSAISPLKMVKVWRKGFTLPYWLRITPSILPCPSKLYPERLVPVKFVLKDIAKALEYTFDRDTDIDDYEQFSRTEVSFWITCCMDRLFTDTQVTPVCNQWTKEYGRPESDNPVIEKYADHIKIDDQGKFIRFTRATVRATFNY